MDNDATRAVVKGAERRLVLRLALNIVLGQDARLWFLLFTVVRRSTRARAICVLVHREIGSLCVYDIVGGRDAGRVVKVPVGVLMLGLKRRVRIATQTGRGLVHRLLGVLMCIGHGESSFGVVEDARHKKKVSLLGPFSLPCKLLCALSGYGRRRRNRGLRKSC